MRRPSTSAYSRYVIRPTAIDLFAGAGGATAGLIQAGFNVIAAVENDSWAAQTYRANHGQVLLSEQDILEVDVKSLRTSVGLRLGDLDLLKACPPCQGFSSLGPNEDDDPRNELVRQVWRFVEEFEPSAVLMENVPALRHDERFLQLQRDLEARGYTTASYLVNAVDFGVPQSRRRLILLGVRGADRALMSKDLVDLLPPSFDRVRPEVGTVIAQAGPLGGTDPVHRARSLRPETQARVESVPVGGTRFDIPEDKQLKCHRQLSSRNATSSYGRIKADGIAPTMTTRCTTPACGTFIHPTEHRGLSLREAALIQTFAIDYKFEGTYGAIEQQIGNAVPVRMAYALGLVALSLLGQECASS